MTEDTTDTDHRAVAETTFFRSEGALMRLRPGTDGFPEVLLKGTWHRYANVEDFDTTAVMIERDEAEAMAEGADLDADVA